MKQLKSGLLTLVILLVFLPRELRAQFYVNNVLVFSPASVCEGDSVSISYFQTNASPFTWTLNGGVSPINQDTISIFISGGLPDTILVQGVGVNPSVVDTLILNIGTPPNPTLQVNPRYVCFDDPPFMPSGGLPAGGFFSGGAVSGGMFNPALANIGWNQIAYNYISPQGCVGTSLDSIWVNGPVVGLLTLDGPTNTQGVLFNGQTVYTDCGYGGPSSTVDVYYNTTNTIQSYSIDFGDGTTVSNPGPFPSSGVPHTYQGIGLYSGSISTVSDSGCTTVTPMNYFFGGSPSVGSSSQGNITTCLSSGDSITVSIDIVITGVNPPGTLYEVIFNDGSPIDTLTHPPPPSISHTFYQTSCDASPAGLYPNSYFFRINATNPCATATSLVQPIVVSENPSSSFLVPDTVCTTSSVTIQDNSYSGVAIPGSGGSCDSLLKIIWKITPNTYTLQNGTEGIQPGGSLNPNIWTSGSSALDLQFLTPGIYTIQQIVGLGTACDIDSSTQVICVQEGLDTASIHAEAFGSTSCSPSSYRLSVDSQLNSFCEPNDFLWSITPNFFTVDSGSVTGSALRVTFNTSGEYIVNLTAQNSCSSVVVSDTIRVTSAPFIQFIDSAFYCEPDTADFFFDPEHLPAFNDGLDSVSFQYAVSPATGWSVVSGALNQQNPSIYFGNPGVYAVSATAMNSCGVDSDVQTVVVQPPTVVNLNLQDSVCSGASVSITANPSGGTPPFTFQWSTPNQQFTGDSIFLSGIVQSVPFTLAVTDSRGCVTQIDSAVHVLPTLQFVGSGFSICQTDTVQSSFSMNGGTPPFQFSWSSGIGLSDSTLLNPFFYGSTALSSYDLTVTDARGCSITETVSVSITSAPPANAGPDIQACIGDSITLAQGTVPGSFNYEWTNALGTVVDTVPSPTVLVSTSSSLYILKVFSSTNCFAYDTVLVSADPVPSSSFTIPGDTLCLNTGITLIDTNSNVATREWRRNGVLIGTSVLQQDSLVNTNPSYTQWVYSLRTVGASGCESTSYDTVYINPSSGLGVISSPVCFGDSMSFAASFLPGTNLSNFVWDFGDNTQSTGSSVSHLYASPGSYTVQLSATDNEGCTQIAIDTVSVALLPVVNFQLTSNCSADTVCLNTPYSFTDLTTSPSGAPITQWSWDFDADGVEDANVQNPVYTFNTSGPQTVTLASTTSTGCASSSSRTYFVQDPLMAFVQLDEDSICGPYALNDSSWTSGQVDSFLWELYRFNDQLNRIVVFSSTSPNPSLPTAPAPVGGTYNWIWALSISNCCETVQSFDTVRVSSIAVPNFVVSPDSGCTPLNSSFQFDGLIQGTPDSLFLDFGDGQLDTLTPTPIWTNGQVQYQWGQVLHQYNYSGNGDTTYYPSVRISNGCGDSTLALPVFVQVNSVQSFFNPSSSSGCAPLNVTFDNLSFGGTQYNWCFDFDTITGQCQGATSNDSLPSYTYGQPGTYVARLIVNNGCSYDTSFQVVDVQTGINTTLQTPAQACVGDTVSVSALVSAPGTAISYEWSFGNGQSDNSLNAATVYDSAGTFIVSLVSLTTDGCRDSSFTSITILPSPEVHFGFVAGCFGQQPVAFFDSSSTSSGTITGTVWDFGDGNSSTQINPTHTYANPGTYLVRLTKFNSLGCSAFTEINVIVHPDPLLDFQYTLLNLDSCGLPQSYQFNNLSQQSSGYVWDFDFANPGQLTSTLNSPTHTYDSVGTYVVALIGENAFGCSDTITQSILVRPALTALFSVNPQSACEGTVFSFSDLSLQDSTFDPVTDWEWDFGDGTTASGSPNVQHVYTQAGVYTAQLNVTTGLGCSDNAYTITVEVLERPVADFIVQEQTLTEVQFTNLSQDLLGGAVFSWDFGDGAISAQESPRHNYGAPGTFPVILITLNPNGCSDTIASDVTIEDLFRVYIPTAFTPNGDGKNEIFYIQGTGIDQMHLEIYDRWGKMIFESRDPSVGWDGTMPNGNPAKQDSYQFKLQLENYLLNEIVNRTGVISLIR